MTDQHPITPPPAHLLKKFSAQARDEAKKRNGAGYLKTFATLCIEWAMTSHVADELQKARDEELEACCEWVSQWRCMVGGSRPEVGLRAARRPKPKSLAEEALLAIDTAVADDRLSPAVAHAVRRALERLQELEGQGDD